MKKEGHDQPSCLAFCAYEPTVICLLRNATHLMRRQRGLGAGCLIHTGSMATDVPIDANAQRYLCAALEMCD